MTLVTRHSSPCHGKENRWLLISKSKLLVVTKSYVPSLLLQAAAHGLPMVATKNGGPVDINKVNLLHNLNCQLLLFKVAKESNGANCKFLMHV